MDLYPLYLYGAPIAIIVSFVTALCWNERKKMQADSMAAMTAYQQHILKLMEEKAERAERLRDNGKPYLAARPFLPVPPAVSRAEFIRTLEAVAKDVDELAREVERLKAERPQGYRRAG